MMSSAPSVCATRRRARSGQGGRGAAPMPSMSPASTGGSCAWGTRPLAPPAGDRRALPPRRRTPEAQPRPRVLPR
eukprot:13732437-Alexandrium_andersonii.AAC.1